MYAWNNIARVDSSDESSNASSSLNHMQIEHGAVPVQGSSNYVHNALVMPHMEQRRIASGGHTTMTNISGQYHPMLHQQQYRQHYAITTSRDTTTRCVVMTPRAIASPYEPLMHMNSNRFAPGTLIMPVVQGSPATSYYNQMATGNNPIAMGNNTMSMCNSPISMGYNQMGMNCQISMASNQMAMSYNQMGLSCQMATMVRGGQSMESNNIYNTTVATGYNQVLQQMSSNPTPMMASNQMQLLQYAAQDTWELVPNNDACVLDTNAQPNVPQETIPRVDAEEAPIAPADPIDPVDESDDPEPERDATDPRNVAFRLCAGATIGNPGNGTLVNVYQQDDDPEVSIVIYNVVCSFSVCCHLNLRDIALRGVNVQYRRENSVLMMRLRRPYTTAMMRSTGHVTCTGATSEQQAMVASRRFARSLQKLGFSPRMRNFRVLNVLGTCSMPWAIRIVAFYQNNRTRASYEPELHPGVTYRVRNLKATLKIYATGSITVNASSVAKVQKAIEHVYPVLYDYRRNRSEIELEQLRKKQKQILLFDAAEIDESLDDNNIIKSLSQGKFKDFSSFIETSDKTNAT